MWLLLKEVFFQTSRCCCLRRQLQNKSSEVKTKQVLFRKIISLVMKQLRQFSLGYRTFKKIQLAYVFTINTTGRYDNPQIIMTATNRAKQSVAKTTRSTAKRSAVGGTKEALVFTSTKFWNKCTPTPEFSTRLWDSWTFLSTTSSNILQLRLHV